MLCDKCRKIRLPHPAHNPANESEKHYNHLCIYQHHPSFPDVLASAESGCEICQLFKPFIIHAQQREAGEVEIAESDCGSSDGDSQDFNHEDPFIEEEDYEESDYNSESFCSDVLNAASDHSHERSTDDESSVASFALSQKTQYFDSDVDEVDPDGVLNWAYFASRENTGPEQLWVTVDTEENEVDNTTRSSSQLNTMRLHAASIVDIRMTRWTDSSFCVDGEFIGSRQSLAARLPALWKWHPKALSIRAGRKKPLRLLRPIFEIFQGRGMLLYHSYLCIYNPSK
jgi:hypothetical protein